MRKLILTGLALVFASTAHAQEAAAPEAASPAAATATATVVYPTDAAESAPGAAEPRASTEPAPGEQREVIRDAAAVQDPFQRGSFWWYVGIIVVAGVILAVLL